MMIMVDAAFNVERERGLQMRFDSSGGLGGREKKKMWRRGETEQVGKGVGVGSREDSFLHR